MKSSNYYELFEITWMSYNPFCIVFYFMFFVKLAQGK